MYTHIHFIVTGKCSAQYGAARYGTVSTVCTDRTVCAVCTECTVEYVQIAPYIRM